MSSVPNGDSNEGTTPALSDDHARRLLEAPNTHTQGHARSGYSGHAALSRHTAGRAVYAEGKGFAKPPGRHPLQGEGQAREDPLCPGTRTSPAIDRKLFIDGWSQWRQRQAAVPSGTQQPHRRVGAAAQCEFALSEYRQKNTGRKPD